MDGARWKKVFIVEWSQTTRERQILMDATDFILYQAPRLCLVAAKDVWQEVSTNPRSKVYSFDGMPSTGEHVSEDLKLWVDAPKERFRDKRKAEAQAYEETSRAKQLKDGDSEKNQEALEAKVMSF